MDKFRRNDDTKVEDLLELLKDSRVQEAIKMIVGTENVLSVVNDEADVCNCKEADDADMGKKKEIEELKEKLDSKKEKIAELKKEIEVLTADYNKLEGKYEDRKKDYNSLLEEFKTIKSEKVVTENRLQKAIGTNNTLKEENTLLNSNIAALQNNVYTLEKKQQRTEDKLSAETRRANNIQNKNDELTRLLSERCSKGYELFVNYGCVSQYIQNLLKYTIKADSFEAFIASLSQFDAIESIWDGLKECLNQNGSQEEWDELFGCLEYTIFMFNRYKGEEFFSFAKVAKGDRFDIDVHQSTPGSKAQGEIIDVYLPGVMNNYTGKLVRKSVVSL